MRINTNIAAINAHRQLNITFNAQSKSTERLASGKRVNRAADDAAGLAISEKMRGQIRGLHRAGYNIQDGLSLLKVMDGGMDTISSMLIRQRELVIQGMNDTNTETDREAILKEIKQITKEIDDTANNVQFNEINLLNVADGIADGVGSLHISDFLAANPAWNPLNLDTSLSLAALDGAGQQVSFSKEGVSFDIITDRGNISTTGVFSHSGWPGTMLPPLGFGLPSGPHVDANGNTFFRQGFLAHGSLTTGGTSHDFHVAFEQIVAIIDNPDGDGEVFQVTINTGLSFVDSTITAMLPPLYIERMRFNHAGRIFTIYPMAFGQPAPGGGPGFFTFQGQSISFIIDGGGDDDLSEDLIIQKGANQFQTTTLNRHDMRSETLGITNLGFNNESLGAIDDAILTVNMARAVTGAQHNRLEHAYSNVGIAGENQSAAESRIRDTDMAQAMTEHVRLGILQQSGVAMLAQANAMPQTVLQILG